MLQHRQCAAESTCVLFVSIFLFFFSVFFVLLCFSPSFSVFFVFSSSSFSVFFVLFCFLSAFFVLFHSFFFSVLWFVLFSPSLSVFFVVFPPLLFVLFLSACSFSHFQLKFEKEKETHFKTLSQNELGRLKRYQRVCFKKWCLSQKLFHKMLGCIEGKNEAAMKLPRRKRFCHGLLLFSFYRNLLPKTLVERAGLLSR